MTNLIPVERIENKIYLIRGKKVMLDFDLAALYQVPTKRLNEQVRRNLERFPNDFMFQLNSKEQIKIMPYSDDNLRSQFATSSWGGRRTRPYVFTENGVAMLSSILRSKRAIQVNILIMRTFTKLRKIISSHKNLAQNLAKLEQRVTGHDVEIKTIIDVIRQLMMPESKPTKKIGFLADRK